MSIEAMKQALELLKADSMTDEQYGKTITDLEQAIATEESSATQEPVGFYDAENKNLSREIPIGEKDWWQPVYTHPQPKREPLTDEQIDEATQKWAGHSMVSLERLIMCREYARAIEAAHGIKGEA